MLALIHVTFPALFCSSFSFAAPLLLPPLDSSLNGLPFLVYPANPEELLNGRSSPYDNQSPFNEGSPFLLPVPVPTHGDSSQDTPAPTQYITITASAPTITETATQTTTVTVTQPPPTPSIIAFWSTPEEFGDLSPFRISYFPAGQANVELARDVRGHTQLAVSYPAGSINPGNADAPVGGAEFYASPIDLTRAKSVTMTYHVYFPLSFQWRKGGKLPGLYGGKTGCSGGDDAIDCFSTRLMWRAKGEGELYLYASRTSQTAALCSHPQSHCETPYGISVGRGAFHFALDAWTTVKQTVILNTPGAQDGKFTLQINGATVIHRDDIFYRGAIIQARNVPFSVPSIYAKPKQVPFSGIFFSTFFGGHDASFASPSHQVIHFAGFNLTINELQ